MIRPEQHLGLINITSEAIVDMLKLPSGSKIKGCQYIYDHHCPYLSLVVEHESIPAISDSQPTPSLYRTYTKNDIPEHLNCVELPTIKTSED